MKKKILITTGSFSFTKKPIIFLGNWCANFSSLALRKKIKYQIFKSKLFTLKKSQKLLNETHQIYESIFESLWIELNRVHSLNLSKRSWRIIIGPWLFSYISIFLKSIKLIRSIKKNKNIKIDKKLTLDQNFNLQSYDLWDFTNKIYKHSYNKSIFSAAIAKVYGLNKIYNNYKSLENLKLSSLTYFGKINPKVNKNLRFAFIKSLFLKILFYFVKKINHFAFYKIYYGSKLSLFKIILKLKEIPFNYNQYEKLVKYSFKKKIRNNLRLEKNRISEDEIIIRDFIKIALPSIYLEGFKDILLRINSSFFLNKIKVIFSCNIQYDYLFKFWSAIQVSKGAKLITGQHGGNFDLYPNQHTVSHYTKISDIFLSWGWRKEKNSNVVPLGNLLTIGKKKYSKIFNKKYLLVLKENYNYFKFTELLYFDDLNRGVKDYVLKSTKLVIDFIDSSFKNKLDLTVRLHPNDKRQEIPFKYLINKRFKNIKFDKGNLIKNIKNYELIIFSSFEHTTLLECIILDKPFISLFSNEKNVLDKKYHKAITLLINAKIFHLNNISAAEFIKKNKDKIYLWWKSKKVRQALFEFSKIYIKIRKDEYYENKIFKILNDIKLKKI